MQPFNYREGVLHAEDCACPDLAAEFGTPCYVYSRAAIEAQWGQFEQALAGHPHQICYAVKANGNLAILALLARLGAGFDIVSGGELARVLRAGGNASQVVFSGIGKRWDEMAEALAAGIQCFNVESAEELARLHEVAAAAGRAAPLAIRVNPDVDARTHPYIATGLKDNKFGVDVETALSLYRQAAASAHLRVTGIACHIGSQLTELEPFAAALERLLALTDRLAGEGIALEHIDLGGGLGIRYQDEMPPPPAAYAETILRQLGERPYRLMLEPGRAIVGNAGILLTRVEYIKTTAERRFLIVDAAMNDLLRPALYQAWHDIVPVQQQMAPAVRTYDVVGPVCETGDCFAIDRPLAATEGGLLAFHSAGAYGFVMASNYNARGRPPEILVDGAQAQVVRARETIETQLAGERIPVL